MKKRVTIGMFILFIIGISMIGMAINAASQVEKIDDPLDNFDKIYKHSSNLSVDSSNPEKFQGDAARLKRTSEQEAYLIYKTDIDIKSFSVIYYDADNLPGRKDMKVYGSDKGKKFTEISVQPRNIPNNGFQLMKYERNDLPEGIRYVKFVISADRADNKWVPQIAGVRINYDEAVQPIQEPIQKSQPTQPTQPEQEIQGIDDAMENFSNIHMRSDNLGFDTSSMAKFFNDKSRLFRRASGDAYFIYKTSFDIRSFRMDLFNFDVVASTTKDPEVFVSSDGINYSKIGLQSYTISNSVAAEFPLTIYGAYHIQQPDIRYLKIVISDNRTDGSWAWAPQISRVLVNRAIAPVEASGPFKVNGPTVISLSTQTPGAQIYYQTDKDAADKLYTEPIKISGTTKITAHAKMANMVTSFAKTFAYFTDADEIVDRYGQLKSANFPMKVTSDEQLKTDVAADEAYYSSLTPPQRDPYGGMPDSGKKLGLKATGFFHIEKLTNGKPVMVDPLGNLYFSLGANGLKYTNTYTLIKGREYAYEWLPSINDVQYKDAFKDGSPNYFSYYVANKIKKTGRPLSDNSGDNNPKWHAEGVERLKKWGFTCAGGFANTDFAMSLKFPSVPFLVLPGASVPGIKYYDIFKPGIAKQIDEHLAVQLPKHKNDPSIIGYYIGNEYFYHQIKDIIPKAKASEVPSKGRLVQLLKEKYQGDIAVFNTAWNAKVASFEAMQEAPLSVTTEVASSDMDDFTELYLDTFYGIINASFRKYDPNHMLIGDRWFLHVVSNEKLRKILCKTAGKYLDAISVNYYSYDLDLKVLKSMYEQSGKPLIFTEFHFGEPTAGLTGAIRMADNEDEKGKMYRNYVEKAAASGYVIGTHWYEYLDQPATGRYLEGLDGENFAHGLVNVADRPYKTMLASVMETNYNIYDIILGNKQPYVFDFGARGERMANKTINISKTSVPVTLDGVLDDKWPKNEAMIITEKDRIMGSLKHGVSAEMRLAWDQENLYIFAHMTDSTPMMNNKTGRNIWNGDALELFVGPDNVDQGGSIQVKDTQLILCGSMENGLLYYWYNNVAEQTPVKMAVKLDADGKGYTIEAAIPLAGLKIINPQTGNKIRFDIGFDDGGALYKRERQFLWNGEDGNNQSREKWGLAVFTD